MAEIGSQWILKGALNDGTVVYWNKTQEYVKDPAHATFCKNKKHETGFEPAALALARRCSTTEPLVHIY